ncbi:MAG: proline racemase family protein [Actinomycetota bacterium]
MSGETEVEGIPAVITEVEGNAFISGYHQFVLDPNDPLRTEFLLR